MISAALTYPNLTVAQTYNVSYTDPFFCPAWEGNQETQFYTMPQVSDFDLEDLSAFAVSILIALISTIVY